MNENKKPRIAEILGVEAGEEFSTASTFRMMYHITEAGAFLDSAGNYPNAYVVCDLISNPDHIIRKPRFTEQEAEDAICLKKFFMNGGKLRIWRGDMAGLFLVWNQAMDSTDYEICSGYFPSIKPGESATLDEIIGGGE